MNIFTHFKEALLHLIFPHLCEGCGKDLSGADHLLCMHCLSILPETSFHNHAHNPAIHIFTGRLPLISATAGYFFTKGSVVQHLLHQVKYKGNKALAIYLGRLLGQMLAASPHYQHVDIIIPLPLHRSKERRRGYNQSALLCEGIQSSFQRPVLTDAVRRVSDTESQTRKSRIERWENMEDKFEITRPDLIMNKHVLLIDDVLTTGATLEACGRALLKASNVQLSIAVLCMAS